MNKKEIMTKMEKIKQNILVNMNKETTTNHWAKFYLVSFFLLKLTGIINASWWYVLLFIFL